MAPKFILYRITTPNDERREIHVHHPRRQDPHAIRAIKRRLSTQQSTGGLTKEDVTSLCDRAELAWSHAGPRTRKVAFTWRGCRYTSVLSTFEMRIYRASDDLPVAARYHRW